MKRVKNGKIKWLGEMEEEYLYPVAEATSPLLFTVTEKDIVRSKQLKGYANPNSCVAACAIKRQYADAIFQRDTMYMLQVHKGKTVAVRYRFSNVLRKAIVDFDNGGKFAPGNYTLLAIASSQTLESKRRRNRNKPLTKRTVRAHTKFSGRGKVSPMFN